MTTESSLQYVDVNIIKTQMYLSNMIRFTFPNYDYISDNDTILFLFNDGIITDDTNIMKTEEYRIETDIFNLFYIETFYVKNNKIILSEYCDIKRFITKDIYNKELHLSSIRDYVYLNDKTKKTAFIVFRLKDDDPANLKFRVAYDKTIFDKNDIVYLTSQILKKY